MGQMESWAGLILEKKSGIDGTIYTDIKTRTFEESRAEQTDRIL